MEIKTLLDRPTAQEVGHSGRFSHKHKSQSKSTYSCYAYCVLYDRYVQGNQWFQEKESRQYRFQDHQKLYWFLACLIKSTLISMDMTLASLLIKTMKLVM